MTGFSDLIRAQSLVNPKVLSGFGVVRSYERHICPDE